MPITYYQFIPGMRQTAFVPVKLIAGNLKIVTDRVTFAQTSTPLLRGTLVGRIDATGLCVPCVATASDGSQNPVGVVVHNIDASAGNTDGQLYVMGEFNSRYMTIDQSWQDDALRAACRKAHLFIKDSLSNDIL